jgi:bleomycin hydrolase
MSYLNAAPVNDGGQFDMAVNIVEVSHDPLIAYILKQKLIRTVCVTQKYGIVPQTIYPESYSSSKSAPLNAILTSKLREYALELRQISVSLQSNTGLTKSQASEKARRRKDEMMQVIYSVLTCTMGTPPKPDTAFTWETYDKDGKYLKMVITPRDFYKKYTGPHKPKDCFSLVNDPRNPYDKLYTVDRLGNVAGGMAVRCKYLKFHRNYGFP